MNLQSIAFVLFGAAGDLAQRMIWPSLYHLHRDGLLPPGLRIVAVVRKPLPLSTFHDFVQAALKRFLSEEHLEQGALAGLLARISVVSNEFDTGQKFDGEALAAAIGDARDRLFFLSMPPRLYGPICDGLASANLVTPESRIVIEKPLGHDYESSCIINEAVGRAFGEEQIFRIDHYLGKETVQNLLALRFANSLFEPLWNSAGIDHVQITVAETVGVEGRWSYYDEAGALRDMVQNHLLQLLALVAMEPPANLDASAVRNEKTKVLLNLRALSHADVQTNTVRGQYAGGAVHSAAVPGYHEEQGARVGSMTETFVAVRAHIDNWRWAGVPFYLRTGKRLPARRSDIVIQFRAVPHNIFAASQSLLQPNRLIIRLQPEERITLELMSKRPGLDAVRLQPVPLDLSLSTAFGQQRSRIAYERLLLDALQGNSTLFVRRDEIEAAWRWIDAIQDGWRASSVAPRPYPAGVWGPSSAIGLTERHGHSWYE